jgi:hypothetical protein
VLAAANGSERLQASTASHARFGATATPSVATVASTIAGKTQRTPPLSSTSRPASQVEAAVRAPYTPRMNPIAGAGSGASWAIFSGR